MFGLPSFTAITNSISDTLSHNSFSHCQLVTQSSLDNSTLVTTNGSCVTAYEIIGMHKYLTPETEAGFLSELDDELESVLRSPHHKIGIMYVRDQSRTKNELDYIFRSTIDTINRLGINADHFIEQQKKDLAENCAYERCILTITTEHLAVKSDKTKPQEINGVRQVIDEMPPLIQNKMVESSEILQAHKAFRMAIENAFKNSLNISMLSADSLLLIIKEEEELTPLSHTDWRTKSYGDEIDLTINDNEEDFINYPPLAYQLIANKKKRSSKDMTIIESNSNYIAAIDREFFPINAEPFSKVLNAIPRNIPIRFNFELKTGTENIKQSLESKKTWLLFFLFTAQARNINSAIESLIYSADKKNKTLLAGHLSVATWANSLEKCRQNKKDVSQAIITWGSQEARMPDDVHAGYYSTLPAFSKKQSSRCCVQTSYRHITTLPLTRPTAPMESGGICLSSTDGRLFPIDPTSSNQDYSANCIVGGMGSGKTVFSSVFNNTFVFGKGNADLPLIAYLDYGSGVQNYLASLRNWLTKEQQHKIEMLMLTNNEGNSFNILEPQFGLSRLEDQELSFCTAFLCRMVNGISEQPIHPQLSTVFSRILTEVFQRYNKNQLIYEKRLGTYVGNEYRMHREIEELLETGVIKVEANEARSWYVIRDKLYKLGDEYFSHSRFCHRQGSATLTHLQVECAQSSTLKTALSAYQTATGTPLLDYITTTLSGLLSRFTHVLAGASTIDVSQARIIGVNLQGVGGTGTDADSLSTKRMFAMLGKYIATRNFWREPKAFMRLVPKMYKEMYKAIIATDMSIKKHEYIDEYKQMKSPELDDLCDNTVLIARKYNMCMTLSSQQLTHMPVNYLSLATNIYALSITESDSALLAKQYSLSESFIAEASKKSSSSDGFGRNILYVGKFKKISGYVVQILRNQITSSYLWNFASGAEDEKIKTLARLKFGEKEAFRRLAVAFPSSSVENTINALVSNSKFDSEPLTREEAIINLIKEMESIT